jgi:hypothetical protein
VVFIAQGTPLCAKKATKPSATASSSSTSFSSRHYLASTTIADLDMMSYKKLTDHIFMRNITDAPALALPPHIVARIAAYTAPTMRVEEPAEKPVEDKPEESLEQPAAAVRRRKVVDVEE